MNLTKQFNYLVCMVNIRMLLLSLLRGRWPQQWKAPVLSGTSAVVKQVPVNKDISTAVEKRDDLYIVVRILNILKTRKTSPLPATGPSQAEPLWLVAQQRPQAVCDRPKSPSERVVRVFQEPQIQSEYCEC